jgi:hypothetical protein
MAKASGLESSRAGDEPNPNPSRGEDELNPEHRQNDPLEEEETLKDDRRNTLSFEVTIAADPEAEEQTRTEFFTRDEFVLAMAGDLEGTWKKLIQREHHWRMMHKDAEQEVTRLQQEVNRLRLAVDTLTEHTNECEIERDEAIAHRDIAVNERNQQAYDMMQNQRMGPA